MVNKDKSAKNIMDHDYIFWMGDLNFRLDKISTEASLEYIKKKDFQTLLKYDQLTKLRSLKTAFNGFKEAPINFRPTYKFDPKTDNYDIKSQRKPAWTDRIIWKLSKEDSFLKVKASSYQSHPYLRQSDHRPVTGYYIFKAFKNERY